MAKINPLTLPTSPGFKRFVMRARSSPAMAAYPFTFQQQLQQHQGEMWSAECTLPAMTRANAEAWAAFLLALRGRWGTFVLGDPSGATPRGTPQGSPSVNLSSQDGAITLSTLGWTASQSNLLKAGDYFQVAKNYLTYPRAFDNAAWQKYQCVVTATDIVAPTGVAEADRVWPDGGATNAWVLQAATPEPYKGRQFTLSVWLKAKTGTPSIAIYIYDGISTNTPLICNLTTSWQRFSETATLSASATTVACYIGGNNSWVEADGPIDMWGAALWSPEQDARLYKALNAVNSGGDTGASIDIFPRVRPLTTDFSEIITANPVGLFRLAENVTEWDLDEVKNFGMGFSAIEAI